MPEQINHNEQVEAQKTGPKSAEDLANQAKKQDVKEKFGDEQEIFGTLMEASTDEVSQKIALGKAIVEEFSKLLDRRKDLPNQGKGDEFKKMDEHQIEEIKNVILPQIEAGNFNLVVQPGGLIAVETADRRITLNAPNQSWDQEFLQSVKNRVKGSAYADRVFQQSSTNNKKWESENN